MTNPAQCHCGSISWERREEGRYICASCKRPLWQPIATAPKDRHILVTGPGGLRIDQVIWGGWELDDTHNWCDADGDRHCNAGITHWMPIPEGPGDE
jgi:hypothetical protein